MHWNGRTPLWILWCMFLLLADVKIWGHKSKNRKSRFHFTCLEYKLCYSYLATRLTRVLPLFELLVTLLVGLVMAPQCKGLGTKWTGNRPLVADTLAVLMLCHLGPGHPTHMATIPREFI